MKKEAVVIHSGGMDSSLCLALAKEEFGAQKILSLSFDYGHRHQNEIIQAKKIASDWRIDHTVVKIECLKQITQDALTHPEIAIEGLNTLVVGRNGLMARLGAIHAHSLGASAIFMGVLEAEEANSGYRDCSRHYMDLMQEILRIDLANPHFEIRTPLVKLTKLQTLELAHRLGLFDYLLENTITCYNGKIHPGCGTCPACKLRNEGFASFWEKYPNRLK